MLAPLRCGHDPDQAIGDAEVGAVGTASASDERLQQPAALRVTSNKAQSPTVTSAFYTITLS